jgi:hypothetical protein
MIIKIISEDPLLVEWECHGCDTKFNNKEHLYTKEWCHDCKTFKHSVNRRRL